MNSNSQSPQDDKPFARLTYAIEELKKATCQLQVLIPLKPEGIEVQWALSDVLGIESGSDDALEKLVALCPDASSIVQMVKDFNFAKFRSVEIDRFEMASDILPPGMLRWVEEQQIKRNGKIWTIHRNDADPFPSNPHAHNYAENLKLDLSDGTLYRYKKSQGSIKRRDLIALRSQVKSNIELPTLKSE